jgi:glycosyltransferase involved in cell wall biosynthesis
VVHDTPENLETIGDAGLGYPGREEAAGLRPVLARLLGDPELVADYRRRAEERVRRLYSWDAVADQYEALFEQVLERRPGVMPS